MRGPFRSPSSSPKPKRGSLAWPIRDAKMRWFEDPSETTMNAPKSKCQFLDLFGCDVAIRTAQVFAVFLTAFVLTPLAKAGTAIIDKPGIAFSTCDDYSTNSAFTGGIKLGPGAFVNTDNCTFEFYLPPATAGTKSLSSLKVYIYGKRTGTTGGLTALYVGTDASNRIGFVSDSEGWNLVASYTGGAAQSVVSTAPDGIGTRLLVRLEVTDLSKEYDLKQVKVEFTYDGVPDNTISQFLDTYATYRCIKNYAYWHAYLWSANTFADETMRAGFQWAIGEIPSVRDLAIEQVLTAFGYQALSVYTFLFDLAGLEDISGLLNNALDGFYFILAYSGPPDSQVVDACNSAGTELDNLARAWSAAFDGMSASTASTINSQIQSATNELAELRIMLQSVAQGLNTIYQNRPTQSNPTGAKKAEVLLQALRSLMIYSYAPGSPLVLSTNSLLPKLIQRVGQQSTNFSVVTVGTSPSGVGLVLNADGTNSTATRTFVWQPGTPHNLSVSSSQTGTDGKNYLFQRWNDGNTSPSRSVTTASEAIYTAIFTDITGDLSILLASGDTCISQASPTNNYDGNPLVLLDVASSSGRWDALVKFNLSGIPPASTITSAILQLTKFSGLMVDSLGINTVAASWTETTVRWNNRPSMGPFVDCVHYATDPVWFITSADLNSAVSDWVNNPSGNNGLYLTICITQSDQNRKGLVFNSREYTTSVRPTLRVTYQPPPDTQGDTITNLRAKTTSGGTMIAANTWQADNDPYFDWNEPSSLSPIVGYSIRLDSGPTQHISVSHYQCATDSLSDGTHTFYVNSQDAAGNWGPTNSFVIKVDSVPPANGTISINNGATNTGSLIININNLSATDAFSGVSQMQFKNEGGTWSGWEPYANNKSGWDLSDLGGSPADGMKIVFVQYRDNAGNAATFQTAIALVRSAVIAEQPADVRTWLGGTATLSVGVSNNPPFTFQWRFNGAALSGATNSTLTISNAQFSARGDYSVVVSNAYGSVTSSNVFLAVVNVAAWGDNWSGETDIPSDLTNAISVATGWGYSLALRGDGTVVGWGDDFFGQIDIPSGLTNAVAIGAGVNHSLAVRADGRVVGWGDNRYGQLDIPADATNIVAISCGPFHSLALRSDGVIRAWGDGFFGATSVPKGLRHVSAISAGDVHSLALRMDGTVVGWGHNGYGQTDGPSTLTNAVSIAAGKLHNLALAADGRVVGWGDNGYGQIDIPPDLTNAVAVAVHSGGSLARRGDGTVIGWGEDDYGQIVRDWPVNPTNILVISQGDWHSLAVVGHSSPMVERASLSDHVYRGSSVHVMAPVVGSFPIFHQWRHEGTNIPGAAAFSLDLRNVQASAEGTYGVRTSNALGAAECEVVALSILDGPPVVLGQPANQVAFLGGEASFRIFAEGTGLINYQWLFGTATVASGTVDRLVITNASSLTAGGYSVVVSNEYRTVASSNATLSVVPVANWGWQDTDHGPLPSNLSGVVAIAVGAAHCLALRGDGSVVGWGSDRYNLSDGSGYSGQASVPDGLSNVVAVAAGGWHSLALRSDGSVVAWGAGRTNTVTIPHYGQSIVPTGLTGVVAIAAGGYHSLALKADGSVVTWGAGTSNSGAFPEYGQSLVPLDLTNAVALAAGRHFSVAATADGRVVAWGRNNYGQTDVPSDLTEVVTVAAGYAHCIALKRDRTVTAWGRDWEGQIEVPPDLTNAVALAAGDFHSLALRQDGTVVAWDRGGELGETVLPKGLRNVVAIAAGGYMSAGLVGPPQPSIAGQPVDRTSFAGGTVAYRAEVRGLGPFTYQWYFNGSRIVGATNESLILTDINKGMDGNYSVVVSNVFGVVASSNAALSVVSVAEWGWQETDHGPLPSNLSGVVGIAAGAGHSLALRSDGTVVAWGSDRYNLVGGSGYSGQASVPDGLSNVVAVAAGGWHSLALRSDGTVVAWGAGRTNTGNLPHYGQSFVPAGLTGVVAIAGGGYHSLALKEDGRVVAWGAGIGNTGVFPEYGQSLVPVDLTNAVALAAGRHFSLAATADGRVVAWGRNNLGQASVPESATNAIAVTAGYMHSLALRRDRRVVAWGRDWEEQIAVPADLSNVVAIAAGDFHSLALKLDGTVVAWGLNYDGQASVPVRLRDVVALAGGGYYSTALVDSDLPQPRMWSPSHLSRTFKVRLPTVYRKTYVLEYKNSLQESLWTVVTWETGNGALRILADTNAISPQRFYRVRQVDGLPGQQMPLRLTNPVRQGQSFMMTLQTPLGGTFVLEFKNSLPESNWQVLFAISGDGSVRVLTDTNAVAPQRFYRVRQQ